MEDIRLTTAVADKSSDQNLEDVVNIDVSTLDGIETKTSLDDLKRKMLRCAKDLQFEQAAILRDKIRIIEEAV
jgi:excinuclease UvrABC helicase subunit UvrB